MSRLTVGGVCGDGSNGRGEIKGNLMHSFVTLTRDAHLRPMSGVTSSFRVAAAASSAPFIEAKRNGALTYISACCDFAIRNYLHIHLVCEVHLRVQQVS